jgi:hypothetical protein
MGDVTRNGSDGLGVLTEAEAAVYAARYRAAQETHRREADRIELDAEGEYDLRLARRIRNDTAGAEHCAAQAVRDMRKARAPGAQ